MQHKFRNYALVILGAVLVVSLVVFICKPRPTVQWSKSFGDDSGISYIQHNKDGGYTVIVTTYSGTTDSKQRWLMELDTDGNKLWEKAFGSEWLDEEGGSVHDVQQTTDGGYVLCGMIETTIEEGTWLLKTDADGNKLWENVFEGDWYDWDSEIQQTADGGYILCGTIWLDETRNSDIRLVKTDANGNKLWDKTFGSTGCDGRGSSVQQTTDDGYIVCGDTVETYKGGVIPDRDIWLIKTDTDGNKLWDKKLNGKLDDYGNVVQQAVDGGYIVCGSTGSWGGSTHGDIWLIKTDAEGNKLWDNKLGSGGDDYCSSVQQTKDGGYIICGNTSYYLSWLPVGSRLWLIKTAADGNKLWDKTFGGILQDYSGSSAQQTTDGGYIVRGRHGGSALLFKIAPVKSSCPFF